MSVNKVNSDGSLARVAGGTLYADAPIGEIHAFGGSVVPSGYLLCDGTAVSRTTYAELFAVIGTAFGSGDGNTTFNIPDLREATTKGVGLSGKSNNHMDSDGLDLGEFIDDQIQNITGDFNVTVNAGGTAASGGKGAIRFTRYSTVGGAGSGSVDSFSSFTFDASRVSRTGDTTEVKAVGVNYIIKARYTAMPLDIKENIKSVVASASDFADFQLKMAEW